MSILIICIFSSVVFKKVIILIVARIKNLFLISLWLSWYVLGRNEDIIMVCIEYEY